MSRWKSFIDFLIKSPLSAIKNETIPIQQLAQGLHKPIIRQFEKRKVYSSFKDNIWSADFVDMQRIIRFNEGFCFFYYGLLIVIKSLDEFKV